jgi:hypothetical protein
MFSVQLNILFSPVLQSCAFLLTHYGYYIYYKCENHASDTINVLLTKKKKIPIKARWCKQQCCQLAEISAAKHKSGPIKI